MIDDVHWADPSTLAALRAVARRVEGYRLLILVTTRPVPPPATREWAQLLDASDTLVTLGPLDADDRADLARRTMGASPGPRLRAVLDGTGGVPLLLAELVRGLGPTIWSPFPAERATSGPGSCRSAW